MSVPNQYTLKIHRGNLIPPFVQVSEEDLNEAYLTLTRSAFYIYLRLAMNADGYLYEYSPTAIANTGVMAKGTASAARQELEAKGYIENNNFYVQSRRKREGLNRIQKEINGQL